MDDATHYKLGLNIDFPGRQWIREWNDSSVLRLNFKYDHQELN